MPRGRPRKPTRIKILTGNPGKRPIDAREPLPRRGRPPCPGWLDGEAKKFCRKLVPELDRLGLLTVVDAGALAGYCQAWAEFRQATETLQAEGRTQRNGDRVFNHPAVSQQRSAWDAIRAFSGLFGLDPSSRARLSVPEGSREKEALDEFLEGVS